MAAPIPDADLFVNDGDVVPDFDRVIDLLPKVGSSEVIYKKSGIPGAGNGIFAGRDFARGEIITRYDGIATKLDGSDILQMNCDLYHAKLGKKWLLQGDIFPTLGHGLGSFANDPIDFPRSLAKRRYIARKDQVKNARIRVIISPEAFRTSKKDSEPLDGIALILQATKPIRAGQEILIRYGDSYWACDLNPPQENRKRSQARMRVIGV